MSIASHLIRIGPAALRVPLLSLWFIPDLIGYIVCAAFTHPDPLFFLRSRFWMLPINVYVAAIQGEFVP